MSLSNPWDVSEEQHSYSLATENEWTPRALAVGMDQAQLDLLCELLDEAWQHGYHCAKIDSTESQEKMYSCEEDTP